MRLNRDWIELHIPHRGNMCLLDEVLEWTSSHIRCRAVSHRSAIHPMRSHGRLGVACGIEYAAQTMAVHGALSATAVAASAPPPEAGLLASLRDVRMFTDRLDTIEAELICEAEHLAGDAGSAMYSFLISAANAPLICGRATVVFDAAKSAAR
jgi:predicted hotdog family 3-hydroxylacyl-ACP dehydratase